MARGDVQKVVLVPRFSTFIGPTSGTPQTFYLPPMNVRQFANAQVVAWRGASWNGGSLQFVVEKSSDMEHWETLTTLSPAADQETVGSLDLSAEWLRVSVVVTKGGTGWMVGDFVAREK